MSETEIVIKGELHSSQGDLNEERELLKEGADHIILEGAEEKNWQFKWRQLWFGWIMLIFEFLFARHFYIDKTIVEDLAEIQDAELQFTRESDASILENAHTKAKAASAVLFFALFVVSLSVGLVGNVRLGALLLLMSSLVPLLLLRIHESRRVAVGRDIQIAEMIEEAAQNGGRIVVIVGAAHAGQVAEALPDDLEAEVRSPAYSWRSIPHLKDTIYPILVSYSVLYVVYSGLLGYVRLFL